MRQILILLFTVAGLYATYAATSEYIVQDGWTVCHNSSHYNNRPLFINNTNAFVLTGDKPLIRFGKDNVLYGEVSITVSSPSITKNLCDFKDIKSMYQGGLMRWECTDPAFPDAVVELEVLPFAKDLGAIVKISSKGLSKSDVIKWRDKGPIVYEGKMLSWKLDVMGHPDLLNWSYSEMANEDIVDNIPINTTAFLSLEMNNEKRLAITKASKKEFEKALKSRNDKCDRVKVKTPDPYLDALATNSVISVDGTWYPPVFVHGAMQWNNRLPGWRTIFGGTMYGWHDRVKQQAEFYIASQVLESDKTEAKANPDLLLTGQHPDSRFYGIGRLKQDQSFYNMQSQFFDQLVEEYRWNDDPEFVELLRPALELHLLWIKECFDPDDDGLYESYINTWPTDSQWYNGGGTAEETCYAYRGHLAAMDMAIAANDMECADKHKKELEKIKNGFFNKLWLKDRGHSGAYIEQGGNQRVHVDPWLYSIFLPIDADLTSPMQSIESLYYSEWALQNDDMPCGGRRVWTSNWIPATWSVREMWPGDNYHLALAYFKAGMPEDGYDILKGNFMHTAYNHYVPANLGSDQGGIDFGDCVHPFTRTLVSGLFGFYPDYPNHKVSIWPSFPRDWNHASIKIPDYSLMYNNEKGVAEYKVALTKSAAMDLRLPINAQAIKSVKVNDKEFDYTISPLPGQSSVDIYIPSTTHANIKIEYEPLDTTYNAKMISGEVRDKGEKKLDGKILDVYDPQGVFSDISYSDNNIKYILSDNKGHHTAIAKIMIEQCPQLQILKIDVKNSLEEKIEAEMNLEGLDLNLDWQPYNIVQSFNADVRNIFKQKYLSPRPNTVSVRLGIDGFSPWTFSYWKTKIPEICLNHLEEKLDNGTFKTPQGVIFRYDEEPCNVAFTSLWDNYPEQIKFDINDSGQSLAFLVCGSTNMMQCNNENAQIIISYEDGVKDILSLVPPINYWNLCPIDGHATAPGQFSRSYYDSEIDKFCLPRVLPRTVELGENCTAMVLPRKLRHGVKVKDVTLKCVAQEVVVGLMGISIAK